MAGRNISTELPNSREPHRALISVLPLNLIAAFGDTYDSMLIRKRGLAQVDPSTLHCS